RLPALVEHLRPPQPRPVVRGRAVATVLARLLRRPEPLLPRPGSHRLGGLLQEPRLPDQRRLRHGWRLRPAYPVRAGLRQSADAVGGAQRLSARPADDALRPLTASESLAAWQLAKPQAAGPNCPIRSVRPFAAPIHPTPDLSTIRHAGHRLHLPGGRVPPSGRK